MGDTDRRRGARAAIFVTVLVLGACAHAVHSDRGARVPPGREPSGSTSHQALARPPGGISEVQAEPAGPETTQARQPDRSRKAAGRTGAQETTGAAGATPDASRRADSDPLRYHIAYSFNPGDKLYYIIENEYQDSAQITGTIPLGFTTTVEDRRTIIQRVQGPATRPAASPGDRDLVQVSWECDRYEVRERGMKGETFFDSLRHTHPPPSLRSLGTIPGSLTTFLMDPTTGKATHIKTTPGRGAVGPPSRNRSSKTAEKCRPSAANLQKLLHDLGPLYLPKTPKRVGEQWTQTHTEAFKTFGKVTTALTCTLRSVREVNDRKIAVIDLVGDVTLQPKARRPAATTRPNRRLLKSTPQRDYKLKRAQCTGTVRFDLTRGRLVDMTLRRELEFLAQIGASGANAAAAQIVSGSTHVLRVQTRETPPPKPIIVGGPRPPVIPADDKAGRATSRLRATTRRAEPGQAEQHPTTRPVRPPPARHAKPAGVRPPPVHKGSAHKRRAKPRKPRRGKNSRPDDDHSDRSM